VGENSQGFFIVLLGFSIAPHSIMMVSKISKAIMFFWLCFDNIKEPNNLAWIAVKVRPNRGRTDRSLVVRGISFNCGSKHSDALTELEKAAELGFADTSFLKSQVFQPVRYGTRFAKAARTIEVNGSPLLPGGSMPALVPLAPLKPLPTKAPVTPNPPVKPTKNTDSSPE